MAISRPSGDAWLGPSVTMDERPLRPAFGVCGAVTGRTGVFAWWMRGRSALLLIEERRRGLPFALAVVLAPLLLLLLFPVPPPH